MKSKTLVVYYTRTGNIKKVALEIAKTIKADVCEIQSGRYPGIRGFFRAGFQAVFKRRPKISINKNTDNYDLIIIGTPNWGKRMASPVRSFIFQREFKKIAFFCVQGGSGAEKIFEDMEKVSKKPIARFFTNGGDIGEEDYKIKLKEFCRKLK